MGKSKSEYGVFIVESLDLEDESSETDGEILHQMLNLCGIKSQYMYIRTKRELEEVTQLFIDSNLRYLHLSCHANETTIGLTFDDLSYREFADIMGPGLKSRRLFLSACKAANFNFAREFIPKYKLYSLIGSPVTIRFDKAALFWSGFYHLMTEADEEFMGQPEIKNSIEVLSSTFKIEINYYSFIRKNKVYNTDEIKEHKIRPNTKTVSAKLSP
jgi:hypothetical protein